MASRRTDNRDHSSLFDHLEGPSIPALASYGCTRIGGAKMTGKDSVIRTDYVEAVCAAFKRAEEAGLHARGVEEEVRANLASTHSDYTVEEWELGVKEAHGRGLFSDERDKKFKTPQGVNTRIKPSC
jgi:hypothetical protein